MTMTNNEQILIRDIPIRENPSELHGESLYKRNNPYKGDQASSALKKNLLIANPIVAIDGATLINMELPVKEYLISPWLSERGIVMVYAPRGIGKTFFALEVAIAVATGTNYLKWETKKKGNVLYLDGEMGGRELQPRMKKLLRGRVLEEGSINFISPDFQVGPCPDLSVPDWHHYIAPYAEQASLIIVDNISTICRTGNENDADSWQIVQEWAIQQKSAGKTVLFIHHAGKGGQQRGTSKREDVMDTVIALKRPDDYTAKQGARFVIEFQKARGFSGEEAESFIVQLEENNDEFNWSIETLEDSAFKKILNLAKIGMSQKEIAEELSVHKSTVSKNFNRAKNDGLL
ncbi:AAA family ATPase [uncultured Methylophaga sp.]|uniref:AAA family ATPase n=1 Tax=uncultured Methylophaga sp. TaxID=285271 RepID=UPI002628E49F|nr:AAA family ATPase [uncultured Methylophaga sp.]